MIRLLMLITLLSCWGWKPTFGSTPTGEINACKYLVVMDFTSDPYGIAKELRAQASAKGFVVASSNSEVPSDDLLKACVMSGSWLANGLGGQLAMRVVDSNGSLVSEAVARATAWWNANRTVRAAVAKIYSQLKYTGFDEKVYRQRIQREFPKRPMMPITEEAIKKTGPLNQVEGIWADTDDRYRLGIVPAPKDSGADYVAVILRSNSPLWEAGEIKAEIRSTASTDVYTCTYFMQNKAPAGMTLTLERKSV